MIINDNIAALNAWRNLTHTGNQMSSTLEHLSSGLRINKAADDAAGLAISQKMMAQINGLDQATRNAQDGISMVQTAEGAMGQAQDILQRMRQLAAQASSDTETTTDRAQLQIEMNQLSKQLTDIANNTEFNTKKLLTGQFASGNTNLSILVGANKGQDLSFNIGAVDAVSLGVGRDVVDTAADSGQSISGTGDFGTPPTAAALGTNFTVGAGSNLAVGSYKLVYKASYDASGTATSETIQLQDASGNNVGAALDVTGLSAGTSVTVGDDSTGLSVTFDYKGAYTDGAGTPAGGTITQTDTVSTSASVSSSAGNASNNWKATVGGGLLILSQDGAENALGTIDTAINSISGERAKLGATQNRLQYVINDLQITSQNLSEAKSRITDTDMAKEMAEFTKDQILQQAGVAMLAQANAMPQAVLKLLG